MVILSDDCNCQLADFLLLLFLHTYIEIPKTLIVYTQASESIVLPNLRAYLVYKYHCELRENCILQLICLVIDRVL